MFSKRALLVASLGLVACGAEENATEQPITIDVGTDVDAPDLGNTDTDTDLADTGAPGPTRPFCSLKTIDYGKDGIVDDRVLSYARNGDLKYLLKENRKVNGYNQTVTYEWSDHNQMLSQGVDQNSDGQLEFLLTQTFVGDSMKVHESLLDVGNDGSIEYKTRNDYDEFGNPTYQDHDGVFDFSTAQLITPANGVPDVTYTWERLDDGRLVAFYIDLDGNNQKDYSAVTTYNPEGQPIVYETDGVINKNNSIYQRADGVVNERHIFQYDAQGKLRETTRDGFTFFDVASYTPVNADGEPDIIERFTDYDAAGHNIRKEMSGRLAIDGTFGYPTNGLFDVYEYDWAGETMTRMSMDQRGDGSVDFVVERQVNPETQALTWRQDGVINERMQVLTRSNGTWNDVTNITYSPGGNIMTFTRDMDGDGQADAHYEREWISTFLGEQMLSGSTDGSLPETYQGYTYGEFGQADGVMDETMKGTYNEDGYIIENDYMKNGETTLVTFQYGDCADFE